MAESRAFESLPGQRPWIAGARGSRNRPGARGSQLRGQLVPRRRRKKHHPIADHHRNRLWLPVAIFMPRCQPGLEVISRCGSLAGPAAQCSGHEHQYFLWRNLHRYLRVNRENSERDFCSQGRAQRKGFPINLQFRNDFLKRKPSDFAGLEISGSFQVS